MTTFRSCISGPASERATSGFTRTDLLATFAMISVLGMLVVILVAGVQNRARLTQCQRNLHEVSRALLLFAADHAEKVPGLDPALSGDLWWWYKEKVKSYVGLSGSSSPRDALFACPADRGYSDPKPFCQTARFDYGSYVFNGVTLPGSPNIAGWKLSAIRRPENTLLVMEWSAHAPLSWHRSKTGRANAPFYSGAESMLGYVDGHVSFTGLYYDGYNAAYTRDPIPGYHYQFSGR